MIHEQQSLTERPSRARRAFQFLFLFTLLVVAPIGSWLYLRSGLAYRKSHLASLEEGVSVPQLAWQAMDGRFSGTGDWMDQVNLVLFAQDSVNVLHQQERLALVQSQFDDRDDVLFYQIVPDTSLLHERMVSLDTAQWRMVYPANDSASHFQQFCVQNFPSEPGESVYLVDRRGTLRQTFSIDNHASLTSLVEVVAILLPPRKLSHPELNRVKEK